MAMPIEKIRDAIYERLANKWLKLCLSEAAAPVCVLAVKQLAGPSFGKPMVCTLEDMPNEQLAALMHFAADQIGREDWR